MIDSKLEGKVVLVTGANHGIGAATARAFAAQGARVFITYFRPPHEYSEAELTQAKAQNIPGDALYRVGQQQAAEPLLDAIRQAGGTAAAMEIDLANADLIPHLFAQCEADLGAVDVLVNNHTHCVCETFDPELVSGERGGAQMITGNEIDQHFAVNVRATTLLMNEYFQRQLARSAGWGRVINISTDAAHCHTANVSYAASKHAIESYSRSAAVEMGKYGITVNVVAPGPVQTGYIGPEHVADLAAAIPLRRVGEPEDIADAVLFFASEQARWITGQLIYVGGGWRIST